MINFELANFAIDENKSKGRRFDEKEFDAKYRSNFGKDRDRIINSAAFRRLQSKTQVFVSGLNDHYRTRLTHSLEVAQIARWIAGALKLNKDLAEIISLLHDLGHPPFGHAGEDALNLKMKNFGGFSHNAHSLKIVTSLESRFIGFKGLNLSWEILEGMLKHNGPLHGPDIHNYVKEYNLEYDLDLGRFSSLESQISAISDDIAYNNHDLEDGLRAGLFKIKDILHLPLIGEVYQEILTKYPRAKNKIIITEAKRIITSLMVYDVIDVTSENIKKYQISTVEDVRNMDKYLVHFSDKMEKAHRALKDFLMNNMYLHSKVNKMTNKSRKIISYLFDFYFLSKESLPGEFSIRSKKIASDYELANLVCDYIAGMTDRFAISTYEKLKN